MNTIVSLISFYAPIANTLGIYVVLSVLLSVTLGFIWYSDRMFGVQWRAVTGVSSHASGMSKSMRAPMAFLIFGVFLVAVAVGVIHLFAAPPYSIYLSIGFWATFGIGTSIGIHAFQRRSWKLYLIDQGYNLALVASCILMAQILLVPAIQALAGA